MELLSKRVNTLVVLAVRSIVFESHFRGEVEKGAT